MRNRWLVSCLVAAMLGAALAGCSSPPAEEPAQGAEQEKETPVQVAVVEKGSLSQQNEIIGTANPSRSVDIIPKLNGELVRLNVKKGDMVSKGATLGIIDADDLEVQLKLEQFSLEQAQDQYKTLHNAQASDLELDQAKRSIEQAQLRVKQASNRLADATLKAPMSGQVIRVAAEAGEFVTSTSPLFTIVSTNPVKFSANVSANQMLLLQNRKETKVEVPDVGKAFTARITYLSPVANEGGFYALETQADNAKGEIKPGMTAKFIVDQEVLKDALLVPTEAIVEKNGESHVFIVKNGRAVEEAVEVLEAQSKMTAVKGNLQAKDQIVIKGQMTLSDGNKVKIIEGAR
ncbi:efflux RND transporter periplasmic adaptor subunit [Paenibacillus dendritiformis]|uniref:efflux RND transporter periplasmic adaptor subunit n=1 Tax=Paenibacillus dendritiformis TaxID=130049 RepID=UPI00365F26EF